MNCHVQTVVLQLLNQKEVIQTRIREACSGDRHDVAPTPQAIQAVSLCSQEVVAALEELERQGAVSRSEIVHLYDSAEYLVEWRGLPGALSNEARPPRYQASWRTGAPRLVQQGVCVDRTIHI